LAALLVLVVTRSLERHHELVQQVQELASLVIHYEQELESSVWWNWTALLALVRF
jgi:hypothetical protein